MIEWFEVGYRLPEPGKPIIVYTPEYDENSATVDTSLMNDNSLLFRVINSNFLPITREATHWAYLETPQT